MFNPFKIFNPQSVLAQTKEWKDINPIERKCVVGDVPTIFGFECLFYNILQIITTVAGLAFFAMFIVGGFKYLTSGGDPKKAASASSTLAMSVIGLIGVIVSWLILLFIEKFTGVPVTKFKLGE